MHAIPTLYRHAAYAFSLRSVLPPSRFDLLDAPTTPPRNLGRPWHQQRRPASTLHDLILTACSTANDWLLCRAARFPVTPSSSKVRPEPVFICCSPANLTCCRSSSERRSLLPSSPVGREPYASIVPAVQINNDLDERVSDTTPGQL